MTSTEKLAMVVPGMREKLILTCWHLNAITTVANAECESSPALDALLDHVAKMHVEAKKMCGMYNQLRSLVGALELEQGAESPQFYVDPMAGCADKDYCPVLSKADGRD